MTFNSSYSLGYKAAPGRISFTTDLWTDPNKHAFMAVTAHWLDRQAGSGSWYVRSELIGFHRVPYQHTGQHLALAFLQVLERVGIVEKVKSTTVQKY